MITYVYNVQYGYQSYNIDNLWQGLSQMGDLNVNNQED